MQAFGPSLLYLDENHFVQLLDWSTMVLFLTTSFVLLLMPGPAVLYIVARSIYQGRLAGLVSALGVGVGTLVHVMAAALGISTLLLSSALAFAVVKYLGAAYLVYLGIQTMLQKSRPESSALLEPQQLSRVFSQGVVVNVLNPKLALFFFAFLPQFIDPTRGTVTGQIVLLGSIFVLLGVLSDSLYALLAGTVGYYLHRNAALLRGQRYFAGSVYIALGVTTALSGSDHT